MLSDLLKHFLGANTVRLDLDHFHFVPFLLNPFLETGVVRRQSFEVIDAQVVLLALPGPFLDPPKVLVDRAAEQKNHIRLNFPLHVLFVHLPQRLKLLRPHDPRIVKIPHKDLKVLHKAPVDQQDVVLLPRLFLPRQSFFQKIQLKLISVGVVTVRVLLEVGVKVWQIRVFEFLFEEKGTGDFSREVGAKRGLSYSDVAGDGADQSTS